MNQSIIPTISKTQVKNSIFEHLEQWKNFAQRITKRPLIKEFILKRDGTNCAWCRKSLGETKIVHHLTYEHYVQLQ